MPKRTDEPEFKAAKNIRRRYIIGLSAIALLVTASWAAVNTVTYKQRNFSTLINVAGQQIGLTSRIAFFSSVMINTKDEKEFDVAHSQLGLAINKMKTNRKSLINGDADRNIPKVTSPILKTIYFDPVYGLAVAVKRFLKHADIVYAAPFGDLDTDSVSYVYLTSYGPYALEPLFNAAVDEYENIARAAVSKIERFELVIWLAALLALMLEAIFIFRPMERQVHSAFNNLEVRLKHRTADLLAAKKAAEQANKAKSYFLAQMSHELRTPLNAIIGFSEIMSLKTFGGLSSMQYKEYTEIINSSGKFLLTLINDILDLSAIEAGKLTLDPTSVYLGAAISDAINFVRPQAENKGLRLENYAMENSLRVTSDPVRLQQILLNILANAIKYTPEHGTVKIETCANENETVSIVITDTGIGMTAEEIKNALVPFKRNIDPIVKKAEGTGLGLPLTNELVAMHGGALHIKSEKGIGTSITIILPGYISNADEKSLAYA